MDNSTLVDQIQKLSEICQMAALPGWKHVVASTEAKMNVILSAILREKDHIEIIRLQEKYAAFASLTQGVEDCYKELELKKLELEQQEEHEQYGQAERPLGE